MEEEKCGECCYWKQIDGHANLGYCKRLPPQPAGEEMLENESGLFKIMRGAWPVTEQPAWCGAFKKVKKPSKSVYEERGFLTI